MIELYTFPEAFGLRNVSPFCLRVEMALKHLDMPFAITLEHNPGKGPKGKLPFIIDGGQTIADSEIIYQHLDKKSNGGLFGDIDAVDRGRGYASVAVATLSEQVLRRGKQFCCLYTDAANPTSNSIYQRIGYRPLREDVDIDFFQDKP